MLDCAGGDFAWRLPFASSVTETVVKDGKRAKTRYRVTVAPDATSGQLLVERKRFKFLELQGMDLDNPVSKALVKRLERKAATAIPGMLVGPATGRFSGLVGLKRMVKKLTKAGFLTAEEVTKFKQLMNTKPFIEAIKREVSNVWLCWGGSGRVPHHRRRSPCSVTSPST